MPKVIGFVGFSGAGKTTLALEVTRRLVARGFRVGAIKDAHCVGSLDTPGKDSARYLDEGASQVILRTPVGWKLVCPSTTRVPIEHLIAQMADLDIVLVEGFKYEGDYPKIEVNRQGVHDDRPWFMESDPHIVACVTDRKPPCDKPTFTFDDVDKIVDFVESLND